MTNFNLDRLSQELVRLEEAGTATSKGRKLQDLMEYLLSQIPGLTIINRNTLDTARSEEKDLWLKHDPRLSGLPFADLAVPVECKNERTRASAAYIREFATKIRDSGGFDGLFVAKAGLAGSAGYSAHSAITSELSHGIRITVITGEDIAALRSAEDLIALLQDRYTELRLFQTYKSI